MDRERFKKLLGRYLDGSASEAEKQAVDRWYDEHRQQADREVFGSENDELRIKKMVYEQLVAQWAAPKRSIYKNKYLAYAASVALIAVLSFFLISRQQNNADPQYTAVRQYNEVTTSVRQVKKLVLPDSSVVWVNALSRIRIPERFQYSEKREIFLDEGEAFFEVNSRPDRPFIVHSGAVKTEVIGTAFNVRRYKHLSNITVQVQHGKVRVTDSAHHHFTEDLLASQKLHYHTHTGEYRLGKTNEVAAAGWREGILRLQDADIDEVALALRNIYGVELKTGKEKISHYRYSLTIRTSRTLEETMRIICSIHQTKYRRENNEVIVMY